MSVRVHREIPDNKRSSGRWGEKVQSKKKPGKEKKHTEIEGPEVGKGKETDLNLDLTFPADLFTEGAVPPTLDQVP